MGCSVAVRINRNKEGNMGPEHLYRVFLFLVGIQSVICVIYTSHAAARRIGDKPDYANFMILGFSIAVLLFTALFAISQSLGYYKIVAIGG